MGSQPIGAIRAERVTLKCPENRPIKLRDRAYGTFAHTPIAAVQRRGRNRRNAPIGDLWPPVTEGLADLIENSAQCHQRWC